MIIKNMKNLIGISGKMGSGKDTVGKIIQLLTDYPQMSTNRVGANLNKEMANPKFKNKKFADALKDCTCLIIGCTREQLEDQEFKRTPLGPEWDRWVTTSSYNMNGYEIHAESRGYTHETKQQMTPRLILQLLGTEAGRQIIHPNIWVNASFADYKREYKNNPFYANKSVYDVTEMDEVENPSEYPNWIFTDMRFPNELEAIKERNGITIRVERPLKVNLGVKEHESETALDDATFQYVIENTGTMEDLIDAVRNILTIEKII